MSFLEQKEHNLELYQAWQINHLNNRLVILRGNFWRIPLVKSLMHCFDFFRNLAQQGRRIDALGHFFVRLLLIDQEHMDHQYSVDAACMQLDNYFSRASPPRMISYQLLLRTARIQCCSKRCTTARTTSIHYYCKLAAWPASACPAGKEQQQPISRWN